MSALRGTIAGRVGDHYVSRNVVVFTCDHRGCEEYISIIADGVSEAMADLAEEGWAGCDEQDYCEDHADDADMADDGADE